eukprot:308724_1
MCFQINPTDSIKCEKCNEQLLGIIDYKNVSGAIDYNEPAQMIWKQDRKYNHVKPAPSTVAKPTISKSTIIKRKKNKNKARKNRKKDAHHPKPIKSPKKKKKRNNKKKSNGNALTSKKQNKQDSKKIRKWSSTNQSYLARCTYLEAVRRWNKRKRQQRYKLNLYYKRKRSGIVSKKK